MAALSRLGPIRCPASPRNNVAPKGVGTLRAVSSRTRPIGLSRAEPRCPAGRAGRFCLPSSRRLRTGRPGDDGPALRCRSTRARRRVSCWPAGNGEHRACRLAMGQEPRGRLRCGDMAQRVPTERDCRRAARPAQRHHVERELRLAAAMHRAPATATIGAWGPTRTPVRSMTLSWSSLAMATSRSSRSTGPPLATR